MNRQMRGGLAYADLGPGVHLKVQVIGVMNVGRSARSDYCISRMNADEALAVRSRVYGVRESDTSTFVRNDGSRSG
jgi:hypothetical protein